MGKGLSWSSLSSPSGLLLFFTQLFSKVPATTTPFQLTSLMRNFCLTFDLPSAWWLSSAELQQQPCACVCWEQRAASADDVGPVSQTRQDWSQQFTSQVANTSATFQLFCSESHTVSCFYFWLQTHWRLKRASFLHPCCFEFLHFFGAGSM